MILNSTRMKNNGCRIPPCLSAYNHLGRSQITNNSSSDGLPEIDVQAAAERDTENVALLPEQQSNGLGQKPGGRSWLQLAVPAAEPQLPSKVPTGSKQAWAGLTWMRDRMVMLALSSFKVLTSCRQLQNSKQDFWPFSLVVRYINKTKPCGQV